MLSSEVAAASCCLDRTYEELKLVFWGYWLSGGVSKRLDRTYEELKLRLHNQYGLNFYSLDRTYEELKPTIPDPVFESYILEV